MTSLPETFAILILAAGNSSRLGKPKQLLQFKNKSLIRLAADEATTASRAVVVVSGAYKEFIEYELNGLDITLAHNPEWQEGMASSIHCGINNILSVFPGSENVIITVCDQPFISSGLFKELMTKRSSSEKNIVASAYENALGVPVLFNKKYFNNLLQLTGSQGAKKILDSFTDDVAQIPFPWGDIDIDTEEDYNKLLNL